MSLVRFVCPHCSGSFELENPPAGEQVACPLCQGTLAIPAELCEDEGVELEFDFVDSDGVEAPPMAFDVGELATGELLPHRRTAAARHKPAIAPTDRAAKEHRRQLYSLVWMIGGGILLAIAVAVLSRL